ncbi:collagen alpha-2(I) chain-like [Onychostruthus taczanowskii]|uniref:collagen alpha-2(I) chain-like n=1 Tax=Onychostruthus taczanowskii TaxID=356909 RepID=UPI001B801B8C|nr:collagen alpha-2(I) chain-like [Onychostruthus taczanowskii]
MSGTPVLPRGARRAPILQTGRPLPPAPCLLPPWSYHGKAAVVAQGERRLPGAPASSPHAARRDFSSVSSSAACPEGEVPASRTERQPPLEGWGAAGAARVPQPRRAPPAPVCSGLSRSCHVCTEGARQQLAEPRCHSPGLSTAALGAACAQAGGLGGSPGPDTVPELSPSLPPSTSITTEALSGCSCRVPGQCRGSQAAPRACQAVVGETEVQCDSPHDKTGTVSPRQVNAATDRGRLWPKTWICSGGRISRSPVRRDREQPTSDTPRPTGDVSTGSGGGRGQRGRAVIACQPCPPAARSIPNQRDSPQPGGKSCRRTGPRPDPAAGGSAPPRNPAAPPHPPREGGGLAGPPGPGRAGGGRLSQRRLTGSGGGRPPAWAGEHGTAPLRPPPAPSAVPGAERAPPAAAAECRGRHGTARSAPRTRGAGNRARGGKNREVYTEGEFRVPGTGNRAAGTGVLECRGRGDGELDTENVAPRGAGQAGAQRREQPPVLGGAGAGRGGPQQGGSSAGAWARAPRNLFGRCRLREAAAAPGLTSAHPGPPAPGSERGHCPALAESVRSHRRSGAAKANTAPRRRYVSGRGGRSGAENGTPHPFAKPRYRAPAAAPRPATRFAPPSSVRLTVHLHPRPGYRPARLGASAGRRGEPAELPHPPHGCHRPPASSLPARPLGLRFAIAAALCHCLRLCSRCLSLPASPEATPTVRSHSPLSAGPRPGPGGGRGLSRAGGVAGRTGWSSRSAAAACRGHCWLPEPSPVGGTDTHVLTCPTPIQMF